MKTIKEFFYSWCNQLTAALEKSAPTFDRQSFINRIIDEFESQSDGGAFDSAGSDCRGFAQKQLVEFVDLVFKEGSIVANEQRDSVKAVVDRVTNARMREFTLDEAMQELPEKLAKRAIILEDTRPGRGTRS